MTSTSTTPRSAVGRRFALVGGGSLVGFHTARALVDAGAEEVLIVDNFAFGPSPDASELESEGSVRLIRGDVLRLPDLIRAFDGVDGVVSLAAFLSLPISRDPWLGLDVNIRGVQNTIEACLLSKVGKLVFASSNSVYGYGPGVVGRLTEETPFHYHDAGPAGIIYGATKIIGENLCRLARATQGLDYVALRYSTVYGERQHARAANGLLLLDAIDRIISGSPPILVGDGNDSKHYVYAGDVASANLAALVGPATDVLLNCSGPSPITTRELIELICDVMGYDGGIEMREAPKGTVNLNAGGAYTIDHERAAEVLGWRPKIDMREGIERVVAWRTERRESPTAAAQ